MQYNKGFGIIGVLIVLLVIGGIGGGIYYTTRSEVEMDALDSVRPVEIISDTNFLEVYVPVGAESDENVAAGSLESQIKFSDGTTRYVPFSDFTYSFDDPTLVRFYPADAQIPNFIGNRVGTTILHLEYKGIKKDIVINSVLDANTPEDPSTYQKIYNTTPSSLSDFRAMCLQKNGKLQEDSSELTCTSTIGNYFISVNGR